MTLQPAPIRVDAHAHIYNLQRYPFHASSGFHVLDNEVGSAEQFKCVLDAHGFTHALLINPLGGYGTDNRCLVETLKGSNGRFKGVAVVAHDASESEYLALKESGVVGMRFNLGFEGSPSLLVHEAQRSLGLARELGWFIQIHYKQGALIEALPVLRSCRLPLIFDHCGRPDVAQGLTQPAFQALLDFGRDGRSLIKLSAAFRFAGAFPYREADPYAQALIEAFGIHRCLWGSDWPFLHASHRVDYPTLLQALERWLPNPEDQACVLGHNPARVFGFNTTQFVN